MGFTSCFQNAENIGQLNLLHINDTHSCPEQLTKFLFREKKLSLQGWALVNDVAATTHTCQILKGKQIEVKLGPKRAATAFGHRWWAKAAR
jgi:hypothetical protein